MTTPPATTPLEIIAAAIKKADSSFFNENYTKQGRAVIDSLRRSGFEVVPVKPPDVLVEYAAENIPFGRLRQSDLIRAMYTIMVENYKKFMG